MVLTAPILWPVWCRPMTAIFMEQPSLAAPTATARFSAITTNGVFTPLYSFTDGHDGAYPEAALVQANDGNLYGTAYEGGTNGYGVIFRITTSGTLTSPYSFTDGHDGADPFAGLVQANNGNLYGTAPGGGTNGDGTVFEFTLPPLSPPVLSILLNGHQSVLSWPASAANYVLQSTTNLASPNLGNRQQRHAGHQPHRDQPLARAILPAG